MERIESLDGHYPFRRSESRKSKEKKSAAASRFSPLLDPTRGEESCTGGFSEPESAPLAELLDAVHEEGERLKEAPTLENIQRYKQSVRAFLKLVLKKMLAVEEKTSGVNVLKRKRFTSIQVIDQKLERLVAEVLRSQSRQLDVLARIDEIHGLLVDLLT